MNVQTPETIPVVVNGKVVAVLRPGQVIDGFTVIGVNGGLIVLVDGHPGFTHECVANFIVGT